MYNSTFNKEEDCSNLDLSKAVIYPIRQDLDTSKYPNALSYYLT